MAIAPMYMTPQNQAAYSQMADKLNSGGLVKTVSGGGFAPDNPASTSTSTGVSTGGAGGGTAPDPNAAQAAALRGQITDLVNSVKSIFDARYGSVDQSAGEQVGKLNDRFGNESGDVTRQITDENQKVGAGYAGRGAYDSSYRGNSVDTVTHAGESQIRDLGTELQDNISKIASWVSQQKTGFDAEKGGMDSVLAHLGESTNPAELTNIRNTIDAKITSLKAGGADNNTTVQNAATLASIAPSNSRSVQLKTTLSDIVAGNADASQKSAIGQKLIASAGLDPAEAQRLAAAFQNDLVSTQKDPNQTVA